MVQSACPARREIPVMLDHLGRKAWQGLPDQRDPWDRSGRQDRLERWVRRVRRGPRG